MSNKSPDICPFGEELQKYWDKRYEYFARWDDGIQTDAEGLYSVSPEEIGLHQAEMMQGAIVLDGFCGIGGSAIAFARAGKKVIAIDSNQARLSMAEHNAGVYGVKDRITFISGDFFEVAKNAKADTVNLDPPWGGPAYKDIGRFLLNNFSPDGNDLLAFSLQHFEETFLRVPLIFDFNELERYKVHYQTIDDRTKGRVISKTVIMRRP